MNSSKFYAFIKKSIIVIYFVLFSSSCGIYKRVDTRDVPVNAQERARKNVQEGRGVSIGSLIGKKGTNYEFSTSNPMWRASLEILDFLPLTTVDYSGGIIITDWYSDKNNQDGDSLKITVRFLSNEINTNSLKIIIHKKKCLNLTNCTTNEINSKIKEELIKSILSKASTIEKEQKNKKNN